MSQAHPGFGGYYEELDWLGNTITWCAVTNWPAPYWNEWYYFIEEAIAPSYGAHMKTYGGTANGEGHSPLVLAYRLVVRELQPVRKNMPCSAMM